MAPIATKDLLWSPLPGPKAHSDYRHSNAVQKFQDHHDIVLKTIRLLVADLCENFNGGHPGGAIGMAAIGVALWRYAMKYAPHQPTWFNRDRFVLSNGHTCLFQYAFLHFAGYRDMTLDQLKSYHSSREDALCPGHPEIELEGVEVTTGPLGQGVANAVGLAIASKHLAAQFNRPDHAVVSNHTWCMIGDACLQEGVALEAISLAGHLRLNNLTIIYDNNHITCDGSVDLTNTEDVNSKMAASGFDVVEIEDGCFDVVGLVTALTRAKLSQRPTFINVHTIIGLDSAVAGDAAAHGAAFGSKDVANMKRAYGFDTEQHYAVPDAVRDFFADLPSAGDKLVTQWEDMLESYSQTHPELASQFAQRRSGSLPNDWEEYIPSSFPSKATASRASSGLVFNPLAQNIKSFMVGTADLSPSVHMMWKDKQDFQRPDLQTQCGINGSYAGRYIHYGVREHAMAAISNGLAAFNPGTIIPVTSSFFIFYLYAAPAVRMGALQKLQVIHAATHDSIGMGEDGPTHQPLELAALYRAMPNILYIRPADSEETAGAWIAAIKAKNCPSIISTSRHALPQYAELTKRNEVAKGAYVVREQADAALTIVGIGAEFSIAVDVADKLASQGVKVRLVSFPCQRLFEKQPREYRRGVLRPQADVPVVVIEAYVAMGWERYADAAVCMSTDRFGKSLPGKKAYEYFGFTPERIVPKVSRWLAEVKAGEWLKGEFVEL
jgi:dihydroxyacetone synthase